MLPTVMAYAATVVAAADLVYESAAVIPALATCIGSVAFVAYLPSSCAMPQAENQCHQGRSCALSADNPCWLLLQLPQRSPSLGAARHLSATWPLRDVVVCPH